MLAASNPQQIIDNSSFAELNKAMVEKATESQNMKKNFLLSKARTTSNIKKNVQSLAKLTNQQKISLNIEQWRLSSFSLSSLSQLVEDINSEERFYQYRGTIGVRKLLSIDNPPVQPIIDANLVPRMIEFMQIEDEPQLQLEAAWLLTNVASGTTAQTQVVMDKGAIPWFINILSSNNQELREQSIWALGNIAGDSSRNRDILLKHGALLPLLKIIDDPNASQSVIKHGSWTISNICRGRPPPKTEYVKAAIPTLFNILHSQVDPEILTDISWALSYLIEGETALDIVMSCPHSISSLVSQLSHAHLPIVIPCLRTLGNICTGTEAQTDAVVNHPGFLETIYSFVEHRKKPVRREALWIMSNIVAGSKEQIKKLFRSFRLMEKLVLCIQNDSDEIRKEALWVISNALKYGGSEEHLVLCHPMVVHSYIMMLLTTNREEILLVVLEGLYHMLLVGKEVAEAKNTEENKIVVALEEVGALSKIDALQDCENFEIYLKVNIIILKFIPSITIRPRQESEDDEEENDSENDINDSDDN